MSTNAQHFPGVALKESTGTLYAEITNDAGLLLTVGATATVTYTIFAPFDPADPDTRTALDGHEDKTVSPAACILDSPEAYSDWPNGANFKHQIDVSADHAFPTAGKKVLIEVTVTPTGEQPRKACWIVDVI